MLISFESKIQENSSKLYWIKKVFFILELNGGCTLFIVLIKYIYLPHSLYFSIVVSFIWFKRFLFLYLNYSVVFKIVQLNYYVLMKQKRKFSLFVNQFSFTKYFRVTTWILVLYLVFHSVLKNESLNPYLFF